jgi:hypothetical protein
MVLWEDGKNQDSSTYPDHTEGPLLPSTAAKVVVRSASAAAIDLWNVSPPCAATARRKEAQLRVAVIAMAQA